MENLLRFLAFVLMVGGAYAQSNLPACPQPGFGHNCWGTVTDANGRKYVGEFQFYHRNGQGIEYSQDGSVLRSGTFSTLLGGRSNSVNLISNHPIETSRFPFNTHTQNQTFVINNQSAPVQQASAVNQTVPVAPAQPNISTNNLPACPLRGIFDNCFASYTFPNGFKYVGAWKENKYHGQGTLFASNGSVINQGNWANGNFVHSVPIQQASTVNQTGPAVALQPDNSERDRLLAEVEAERKKRQELEEQLRVAQQSNKQRVPSGIERRVALVIGNSTYKVSPLNNPANDATDITNALNKVGFRTTLIRNATLGQMRDATRKFAEQLQSADVALIYFAGHGIESNRKNYMIPVNADLKFEYELTDQAYDAGSWLEMLETIKSSNSERVNIVILDACRNNNLIGSRSLGSGLGRMDAPTGTFLSYSTAPGKVAADGSKGQRNSPFTRHLLNVIQQPGLQIEEAFKEVRRNVSRDTNGAQVPWESTSLVGKFYFTVQR